jgi:hypothetical protein
MRNLLLATMVAAIAVSTAQAQLAIVGTPANAVTVLNTPPGSVLVLRGGQVYELNAGDSVFPGDQVFTRTNGALRFSFGGCDIGLGGQQSISIPNPPGNCASWSNSIASLAPNTVIANVTVGTGGTIAATPTILLAALGAGGIAAATSGGDPASP